MDGATLVLAALFLGVVAVPAVLWATSADNVDTAFSGFAWTLLLVGSVVGMIWAFGAWIAGG